MALSIVGGPILFRATKADPNSTFQTAFQFYQYFSMGWVGTNLMVFGLLEILQMLARPFDPGKRIFLSQGVARGVLTGTTLMTVGGWIAAEAKAEVVPVDIHLPTLPKSFSGLRIAQISDVHIGPLLHRTHFEGIVDQVMALNADAIFITGDLVDGMVDQIKDLMEPLKRLKAKDGVYFCTGNHEYYSGVDEWITYLETVGIHVFKNSNVILTRPSESGVEKLMIAGVHDWHGEQFSEEHRSDPFKAAKTEEAVSCKILLAHNPYSIDDAAKAGFDFQISGHTHAGQFYPFVFIVKLRLKHNEGLYQINDKTQLYVNRGTGYWGPPNRLGKRSEITHYTLK